MKLSKTYIKREIIKGRTFKIEIFDDAWGFPYTRIIEELRPKKHLFDFSHEKEVACYWVGDGEKRIEYAVEKIAEYIEKGGKEEIFKKNLTNGLMKCYNNNRKRGNRDDSK